MTPIRKVMLVKPSFDPSKGGGTMDLRREFSAPEYEFAVEDPFIRVTSTATKESVRFPLSNVDYVLDAKAEPPKAPEPTTKKKGGK